MQGSYRNEAGQDQSSERKKLHRLENEMDQLCKTRLPSEAELQRL